MLGVHRNDLGAVLLGLGHDQLPGADQGFLVGKADSLPRPDGGQGGLKPQHAHHGGNHRVGLGQRRGGQKPRLSMLNLDLRQVGKPRPKLGSQLRRGYHGQRRVELAALLLHQVQAAAAGEGSHGKSQVLHHGKGLAPDGAGGA